MNEFHAGIPLRVRAQETKHSFWRRCYDRHCPARGQCSGAKSIDIHSFGFLTSPITDRVHVIPPCRRRRHHRSSHRQRGEAIAYLAGVQSSSTALSWKAFIAKLECVWPCDRFVLRFALFSDFPERLCNSSIPGGSKVTGEPLGGNVETVPSARGQRANVEHLAALRPGREVQAQLPSVHGKNEGNGQ